MNLNNEFYLSLLGNFAAICTSLSFIPQAIRIILTKDTKSISRNSYLLLNIGIFCWLLYGILKNEFPIILANLSTIIFTLIILVYKIKEKD